MFRALHAFGSIRARILAGIGIVLALSTAVSLMVWQAGNKLEGVLKAEEASQRMAQQTSVARNALLELRLGVSGYLRTEGAAERGALETALGRLERAAADATAAQNSQADMAHDSVALLAQIRTTIPFVAEAIENRRVTAAQLDDAAAVLANSSTTLAEAAARTDDRNLTEPAAALLSAVSRAVTASTRFSRSSGTSWTAQADVARARFLLDTFLDLPANPPRIHRLSSVTADALEALTRASDHLAVAVQGRTEQLAELSTVSERLEAAIEAVTSAIAAERQYRRSETIKAQARLRVTVIWTTATAACLGVPIAVGLFLSITRSTRRLTAAMLSVGEGRLDHALPEGDSSELGQLFAAAESMRSRVQAMVELEVADRLAAQKRLIDALESSDQGVVLVDNTGHLAVVNSQMSRFYPHAADLLHPGTIYAAFAAATDRAPACSSSKDASELPLRDGRWVRVSQSATQGGGFVAITTDVTALKQRELELGEINSRFAVALSHMSQGLCLYDSEEQLLVINDRFYEIYSLPPNHIGVGSSFRDVLQAMNDAGHLPVGSSVEKLSAIWTAQLGSRKGGSLLQTIAAERLVAISYEPTADGGWVATYEDVTERQRAEQQAVFLSRHDALTKLPNRVLFHERIEQVLAEASRGAQSAVLCLDLDRFKPINDTLGHPIGDKLLQAVAERLQACIREVDTVARLGGDEFAIVQVGLDCPEDAERLARRLVDMLGQPFDICGHHVSIGTSVGVALIPHDGTHTDALLKHADTALYRAKLDGRGTHRFFEREMDEKLQARRALELDLRRALAVGEFELFYQPLVSLVSNQICGFEALMRWRHPTRGLVSPAEFIPIAEEIGLVVPLGAWALEQACAEAALWPHTIKVAVNLSPVQFKSGTLVEAVTHALERSGLAAKRLELEITESVLLQNNESTLVTLHELRDLGVQIAMDDFGTGYSSLSYLRSFPFDKIKIDQSFIRDLGANHDSGAIVRAVTGLGASLGMITTAEGVETYEQLAQLRAESCTQVQGYLLSRPCPASDIQGLLQRALKDNWLDVRSELAPAS